MDVLLTDSKENRVYLKNGSFSRKLWKRDQVKEAVLKGAQNASEGLTEVCGSEAVDLAVL